MTEIKYKTLVKTREIMSMIGWLLMVINMCIGVTTVIASILKGISLMQNPGLLIVIVIIAIIIGIFAVVDMAIYRKIKTVKIFDNRK